MAIQVLSKLLDQAIAFGMILFHSKCSKLNLIHLDLGDDLMVFIRGDMHSLQSVSDIFDEFYHISDIKLNPLQN